MAVKSLSVEGESANGKGTKPKVPFHQYISLQDDSEQGFFVCVVFFSICGKSVASERRQCNYFVPPNSTHGEKVAAGFLP